MSGEQMERNNEQLQVDEDDEDEDTIEFEIQVVSSSSSAESLAESAAANEEGASLPVEQPTQLQQDEQAERCAPLEDHEPDQRAAGGGGGDDEEVAPKVQATEHNNQAQVRPSSQEVSIESGQTQAAPAATSDAGRRTSAPNCDELPAAAAAGLCLGAPTPTEGRDSSVQEKVDECDANEARGQGAEEVERIPQLGLELRQEAACRREHNQADFARPGDSNEPAPSGGDTSAATVAAFDLKAANEFVHQTETQQSDQSVHCEGPPNSPVADAQQQQTSIGLTAEELTSCRKDALHPEPEPCKWRLVCEPVECPAGWQTFRPTGNDAFELVHHQATPQQVEPARRLQQEAGAHPDAALESPAEEREGEEDAAQVELSASGGGGDGEPETKDELGQRQQQSSVDISVQFAGVPSLELGERKSPAGPADDEHEDTEQANSWAQSGSTSPDRGAGSPQAHLLSASSSSPHLIGGLAGAGAAQATYTDDEDLEREFDEEPEFKMRQVELKRNRNPRDEYELGGELGRGKFGTVFRCTESASGLQLAAKFVHMRRREDREDVEREVALMSVLQHKRLLQLYDAFDDGQQEMCLITELVAGGELFERIVDNDFDLTERKAAIFMRQICEGVEYMHSQQIVHLDMKPENILCVSRTGIRIKLIDFGLARRLDPARPIRVLFGTPDFAAPEVLAYENVTLATDMWSVGVICYVLLSGLSPFMGDSDMDTMANVMRATFDFNDHAFEAISELAKDFIAGLLVRDPRARLAPGECLKHAWLQRGGAPLEAAFRERRESNAALMISAHHRLALEQAALLAAGSRASDSPPTPPLPSLQQNLGFPLEFDRRRSRVSFGGESTSSGLGTYTLDKRRLKKYVIRRKWHKTVHAIMALGRMGANLRLA